jgi:hypothetical protein
MPIERRPAVLFAGNKDLNESVKSSFQDQVSVLSLCPNLRPTIESEDLGPAQASLAGLYSTIRRGQMLGVDELENWSAGTLQPTAYAEGRMIRFLNQLSEAGQGLLGVDLGASHATVAAAFGRDLKLCVYPQLGLGESLSNLLRYTSLQEITKWLALDIPAEAVQEYLFQKSIYPASLPCTIEDLAIEQAIARQTLLLAMNAAAKDFPPSAARAAFGLTPYFEPIVAAGSTIAHAPSFGQSLLLLLDAIQPMGITTIILDQNNLLPALGAAASRNPLLPVQVLESGAFTGLATVVAPYVVAHPGVPILRVRLVDREGNERQLEVKQGALENLPLPIGKSGRLFLQSLHHHADIGLGPDKTRPDGIPVTGTALGVVIDARGRPLRLSANPEQRRETIMKWQRTLGG